VVQVNLSVPAKTVPEFIAYAKANPGKVNFGTGGSGTAAHVAGELLKMMTGIDLVHVPYRGGAPALADMLGGHVQALFSPMPEAIESIRASKVRALAVTTAMRSEGLPDVPTMSDFVPGYEASSCFGVGAPKIPPPKHGRLNMEINAALANLNIRRRLAEAGAVLEGSPSDFEKLIADETAKWARL
jgi:tripartite-type tricarboxylate transporter receptor subunit TctC